MLKILLGSIINNKIFLGSIIHCTNARGIDYLPFKLVGPMVIMVYRMLAQVKCKMGSIIHGKMFLGSIIQGKNVPGIDYSW